MQKVRLALNQIPYLATNNGSRDWITEKTQQRSSKVGHNFIEIKTKNKLIMV